MTDKNEYSPELGLQFLEGMANVVETMNGYRAMLIDNGYSPEAAEQMIVDLHRLIINGGKP